MNNKFQRGDFDPKTQKYFWSYINKNREYWVSLDKFKEYKARQNAIEYKNKKRISDVKYRPIDRKSTRLNSSHRL